MAAPLQRVDRIGALFQELFRYSKRYCLGLRLSRLGFNKSHG